MKIRTLLGMLVGLKKMNVATAAPNAFISPVNDFSIHAGQTMEIVWVERQGEQVDLRLLTGRPENLRPVTVVAENIPNSGNAYWKVPQNVSPGLYSMEITADDGIRNYSPFFLITDPVTMAGEGY